MSHDRPIRENSLYEHDAHGRVRVVSVRNGVVSFQKEHEHIPTGAGRIPVGKTQSAAGFRDATEPADVTVGLDTAILDFSATET